MTDVHLMGTVHCTKTCWDIMKEQEYGRVVVTSSSSGLYGNFGQTNYGAAKMGVIGMMNTLINDLYIVISTPAPAVSSLTRSLSDSSL